MAEMAALAKRPHEFGGAAIDASSWDIMRQQASVLVKSGFLPSALNTPEKALAIIMKASELRIPPMYGLSNIAIINGKPVAGAELMLAMIYRDMGDNAIKVVESDADHCTVRYQRPGWERSEQLSFTIEDAQRAGLLGKENWKGYPAAMLRARCISAVARLAFPDVIGGLYTPEEMGAPISIDAVSGTADLDVNAVERVPAGEVSDFEPSLSGPDWVDAEFVPSETAPTQTVPEPSIEAASTQVSAQPAPAAPPQSQSASATSSVVPKNKIEAIKRLRANLGITGAMPETEHDADKEIKDLSERWNKLPADERKRLAQKKVA